MKHFNSVLTIICLSILLPSCNKKEKTKNDTVELEEQVKKFKEKDKETIKLVFDEIAGERFISELRDFCKLQDFKVNSYFTPIIKDESLKFFKKRNLEIEGLASYESLFNTIKWIESNSRFVGIHDLKVLSSQTGKHKISLKAHYYFKDYSDKKLLPQLMMNIAGVYEIDSEEFLKAALKVYKFRYLKAQSNILDNRFSWADKLESLYKLPKLAFLQEIHYMRNKSTERLAFKVITKNKEKTKVDSYFETNRSLKKELKVLYKGLKEKILEKDLIELTYVYKKGA